ncbi:MAG: TetR/AcrR family transcriptional regulator [Limosilactobacillus sp.]
MKNVAGLHKSNREANALTRESIEEALLQLMAKQNYEKITITSIVTRAGVSRTAYYRNYTSKDDILSDYLRRLSTSFAHQLGRFDPVTETAQSIETFLNQVREYKKYLKILLDAGFAEQLRQGFRRSLNADVPTASYQYYANVYWISALTGIAFEWVQQDFNLSDTQLTSLVTDLLRNGIRTVDKYHNRC